MIEGIPLELAAGGVVTAAVATAAAIRHYRKGGTVEADIDGDGEADITMSSPSCDDEATETYEETGESIETAPQSPTPTRVKEIGGDLDQITGIGPSRSEDLKAAGFDTAADLYYAADDNITAVSGIGDHALGLIREDIGGIDYEGNGSSVTPAGEAESDGGGEPAATDGNSTSTDEAAA